MPEGVDVRLHHKVDALQNMASQLQTHLEIVGSQVDTVGAIQLQTKAELADLSGEFTRFRKWQENTSNVQFALTEKSRLENQLDIEFGWYKKVRMTAAPCSSPWCCAGRTGSAPRCAGCGTTCPTSIPRP